MATNNDPAPTPTPEPKADAKITRGDINKAWLTEIANAKKVAHAALDADNATGLNLVELDSTLAPNIISLTGDVEKKIAQLKTARVTKSATTKQEEAAREALITVIQPIQTAAKRKFKGADATQRDAYYIGESLGNLGLPDVLIAAKNVLARLTPGEKNAPPQDVLAGIKTDGAIKDLAAAIAEYSGSNEDQDDQQLDASALLETIAGDIATLAEYRRDIQLAAEQAWPWRSVGVATRRKTFLLPADRPVKD